MLFIVTSPNNGVHISNIVPQYPVIPTGIVTVTTKKLTLYVNYRIPELIWMKFKFRTRNLNETKRVHGNYSVNNGDTDVIPIDLA